MSHEKKNIDTNMSFYDYWSKINEGNGHLQALEYFGNAWTYAETDKMFMDFAKSISCLNIKKGDTITICSLLVPSTIAMIYAANMLGIQINLISKELLAYNTKKILSELDTDTLLILDKFYPAVANGIAETSVKNIIVNSLCDDAPDFVQTKFASPNFFDTYKEVLPPSINYLTKEEFVNLGKYSLIPPKSIYVPYKTAVVLFTGGSTGIPKGVEIYNERINGMAKVYEELGLDYARGHRNGLIVPANHGTGFIHGLTSPWGCYNGGTVQVCLPLYNRFTFAQDIVNYNLNGAIAAPSHYAALAQSDVLTPGSLANFINSTCGGEAVPLELAQSINGKLKYANAPHELMVVYGYCEGGPMAICTPYTDGLENKVGSPIPGVEARIVDDYGNVLDDNERGNLEIKTEHGMKGYFNQPELTKQCYTEDEFFITGDVAKRDNSGYYEVEGRASDSHIAPSGKKYFLFDLEKFIYKAQPEAVAEAEAVGLSIKDSEQKIPVVHAVLNSNFVGKEAEIIADLDNKCKNELGIEEVPKGFKIRTLFETNPISTKRDYMALAQERTGYHMVSGNELQEISFADDGNILPYKTTNEKIEETNGKKLVLTKK